MFAAPLRIKTRNEIQTLNNIYAKEIYEIVQTYACIICYRKCTYILFIFFYVNQFRR